MTNWSLGPCPEIEPGASEPLVSASELLVLPISLLGILGNVLNLVVLTDRAMRRSIGPGEGSANCGLVALATSDLLFCASALPFAVAPKLTPSLASPAHLYGRLNAAVISAFIMTSTLLTVVMAGERYVAVCHPLLARRRVSLRRTKTLVMAVFVFSAVFNLPLLWGAKSIACRQSLSNGSHVDMYYVERVTIVSHRVDTGYRVMWAVVGNLLPLVVLIYCNFRLVVSVKRALGQRREMMTANRGAAPRLNSERIATTLPFQAGARSTTVTITLVCIMLMFLVLVAPSETLKLHSLLSCSEHAAAADSKDASVSLEGNRRYRQIEAVTNCMQSLSFCLNFLLYCFALKSFRLALVRIACRRCRRRQLGGPELVRLAVHGPPDRRTRQQPIKGKTTESETAKL